jgi:hypothetical protein
VDTKAFAEVEDLRITALKKEIVKASRVLFQKGDKSKLPTAET